MSIVKIDAAELRSKSCARTGLKSELIDAKYTKTTGNCAVIVATCVEMFAISGGIVGTLAETKTRLTITGGT